ncbi:MAG: L-dopachrome tautomerase-related protein [Pleurocapsa sp. MO_192.B19]|nr:L-dopachrome tautomerase-related protein [Pleurocapsa sp. MO_192.B19]
MANYRILIKVRRLSRFVTYLVFVATVIILFSLAVDDPVVGQTDEIEIVAEFPAEHPPGNIAITPKGRLIMSQHQFYGAPLRVVEVDSDGNVTPFPNETWSSQPNANGVGLNTVLGLRSDKNGIVWMLDRSSGEGQPGKIVAWDTIDEELYRVIYLPQPIIAKSPFLNDLAVDLDHNAIYITDTASGDDSALIVVDLNTGFSRRVLEGDSSTRPEDIPMVIDERTITLAGEPAKVGANPITIDPNNEWVYYAPMSGTSLYRISTKDLLDESLSTEELSARVQRYGDKPICDGITVDGAGNVYITAITDNAIGVVDNNGKYRTLYQDDKLLSWTDGMAFSDDNYIYVTVSQLQNSPPLNNGENDFQAPFYLVKFPALLSGEVGR